MPFSLIDVPLTNINVRLDADSVDTPEKLSRTLTHLQEEINRQNRQLFDILIAALGTCAYTDGAGV